MNNTLITPKTTIADVECVLLARCGFSYKLIARRTGLTIGQVGRRIKLTDSSPKRYRNGETTLARRIAESVHEDVDAQMKEIDGTIRKQLQEQHEAAQATNP